MLTKTLSATAVVAVMITGLTGCAGGGNNGLYFGVTGYSEGSGARGHDSIIEVDGKTLYYTRECGEEKDDSYSVGQISEDGTQVTWIEEGSWSGNDPILIEDGVISLAHYTLTKPEKSADARELAENCDFPKSIKQPAE